MKNRQKESKRPRRNVPIIIVEGSSDKLALGPAFVELYNRLGSPDPVFCTIHGDITTNGFKDGKDIEDKFYKLIFKDFFRENKLFAKDIAEIIQIVDTDGAYIPEEAYKENGKIDKPIYKTNGIVCRSKKDLLNTHKIKCKNLDILSSLTEMKVERKVIPYRVYYFSSNLDHFLHNDANLKDSLKEDQAFDFSDKYDGNLKGFVDYFLNNDYSNWSSYEESWEYIKKGLNSLSRHTNLNLLINELWEEGNSQ